MNSAASTVPLDWTVTASVENDCCVVPASDGGRVRWMLKLAVGNFAAG